MKPPSSVFTSFTVIVDKKLYVEFLLSYTFNCSSLSSLKKIHLEFPQSATFAIQANDLSLIPSASLYLSENLVLGFPSVPCPLVGRIENMQYP